MPKPEIYISTDRWADGPNPGPHSMLSFGDPMGHAITELRPKGGGLCPLLFPLIEFVPNALPAGLFSCFDLPRLATGLALKRRVRFLSLPGNLDNARAFGADDFQLLSAQR